VQKARRLQPVLDAKVGLTIAIFCAGTPSTRGTLELLRHAGVEDPQAVSTTTLFLLKFKRVFGRRIL
jgi:coenzyme F420 hydrogenase subunit beta